MNAWLKFTDNDYSVIWDRFYSDFHFKPNYHERSMPAISEPAPFVTFDLSADLTDETRADIDSLLLNSFRAVTPPDRVMYSLDWQHTCYRFDPRAVDNMGPIGWFPDGDYHVFLADDFTFGTFGHPWQQSLCIFGQPLLDRVERSMRDSLNVLRAFAGNEIVG